MELQTKIESRKDYQARQNFIQSQADTKIRGWKCPKHKIIIGDDVKICPECFKEQSLKKHGKEIKEKGIWIGTQTKKQLHKKYKETIKMSTLYKKKKRKNKDFKKKQYEASKKESQRRKEQRMGHSL